MTTFRTRLAGVASVVAVLLALGLGTAAPAAAQAGPAYPPAPGDDTVVEVDDTGADAATDADGAATGDRPDDGTDGDAAEDEDGAATGDRADAEDALDDPDVFASAPATGSGAPADPDPGRGVGPVLVIVAAAALLGTAVVAIARRI